VIIYEPKQTNRKSTVINSDYTKTEWLLPYIAMKYLFSQSFLELRGGFLVNYG